jgi:hypothetical protein
MRECQEKVTSHEGARHFTMETYSRFLIQHTSFQAEEAYGSPETSLYAVISTLQNKFNAVLERYIVWHPQAINTVVTTFIWLPE